MQVLAPLEEPFQSLLDAFDSLDPDEIVQPILQAVDDAISSVLDAAPIGDAVAAVDESSRRRRKPAPSATGW